jgi:hypothetical protein
MTKRTKGYYKGKPIDEMSREELMAALIHMGNLYTRELEENLR